MKIRWKHVERYFNKRGFHIYDQGQDKYVSSPGKPRQTVRIAQECCFTANAEVTTPYLRHLESVFGVTREQILQG